MGARLERSFPTSVEQGREGRARDVRSSALGGPGTGRRRLAARPQILKSAGTIYRVLRKGKPGTPWHETGRPNGQTGRRPATEHSWRSGV